MISPDNGWKYFCSNKEHNGIRGSDSKFTRQTQPRVERSPTYVNTNISSIHRGSLWSGESYVILFDLQSEISQHVFWF